MAGWFERQTFYASDFDVANLAEEKARQGLSVSVVLPAHNEAATVSELIASLTKLRGQLLDEIVVVDDRSQDNTAALAEAAGATVYESSSLMPAFGPSLGKGDALWRSLSVTSSDVVVFMDADLRSVQGTGPGSDPGGRFVPALLGPLLSNEDLLLVKACYERPLREDGQLRPTGGGRVTELMARPLLNLYWPALAGLVQPLSGEYAARRSLLETLPFFTGYGVEFGLLVDTLTRAGAHAIGQVDLGARVHFNQPIDALSRMAFAIAQVAMQRSGQARAGERDGLPDGYLQFERDAAASDIRAPTRQGEHGRLRMRATEVAVLERPPLSECR